MALVGLLIPCFVISFDVTHSCQNADNFVGASSPGDIVIGGLFAVHGKMLHPEEHPMRPVIQNCAGFEIQVFLQTLAMIHAIEMINNSTLLSGIILGYEIYDTCAEVTKAMGAALRFLAKFNASKDTVEYKCNYSDYIPRIKAVIGSSYSEIAMAVSRLLNLQLIPLVSHASSAEILSDKIRFPSFLRTVPSDFYQTRAMARLIYRSGWNWIGLIATDDDYGRSALESFGIQAMANNVCIAFKEMLPAYLSDGTINAKVNQALEKIVQETRVNVIVVFLRQFHVTKLFGKAIERNIHKIWIASDNWSAAVKITTIPNIKLLGTVVGFAYKSENMSTFHDFLKTLHLQPTENNLFLKEYSVLLSTCAHVEDQDLNKCISNYSQENLIYQAGIRSQIWRDDFLRANIEPGFIQSTMLAVHAIAYAVREQCKDRDCKNPVAFAPWEKVKSTCSRKCRPGQMKKVSASPHTCCYECVNCPEDHYTNQTDMDYCFLCNNKTHWSPVNSTTCYKKTVEYLSWNDWFAILLIILSGLGVVLIFVIGTIFTRNLDTPVVKASGGLSVCYVILLCHFFIFASTGFFIGEPREFKCKTRQAFFGISFALCISCILMKSLKILLAFSFDPKLQNFLKCLYKPVPIVVTCTGIQVVICTFWVIFRSPFVEQNFFIRRVIILECNEGSIVAFGVMLGYIAALAFICFIFAFKGRKLPENYNEAKFITFGMLIYFIAWITFIPVYTTTFGKYRPAVEITVILISNYGILCCTFLPKCYIILYKQETNTKSAFLKIIYNYSSKSAGCLTVSQISLESNCTAPQYPITNSCCKSEKTSVNGNCHFEVSKHSLIRENIPPKNTAGTISRKRLSSI
ncbi:flap endonuclease GEN-like protein 1 [Platysternon megacephalum]|uniref:G-protein coupled receptor family C group 6 member A n=1 Tax=Platysternon megacephalum TaxID=55544 RepID=A0A4D9F8P1_9SAUR|nr:flap endonuclease GEN-like protein 1 [Platysternon megacephalum]